MFMCCVYLQCNDLSHEFVIAMFSRRYSSVFFSSSLFLLSNAITDLNNKAKIHFHESWESLPAKLFLPTKLTKL